MIEVVFRVDANESLGHGHWVRCLALAELLKKRAGASCRFVTRFEPPSLAELAIVIPKEVTSTQEGRFVETLHPKPDVLITDLARMTQTQLDGFSSPRWKWVCLDDGSRLRFDCDLLINPSLSDRFVHRFSRGTRYRRGLKYLILRSDFENVSPYEVRDEAKHLLICLGGSDGANATTRVFNKLERSLPPQVSTATILIGSGFTHERELRRAIGDSDVWRLEKGVSNMAEKMLGADLGLFSSGTLLYEAAAVGLPSIFISLNEAQAREAREIHRRGAGQYLGPWARLSRKNLFEALASLEKSEVRRKISLRARKLVAKSTKENLISDLDRLFLQTRGATA